MLPFIPALYAVLPIPHQCSACLAGMRLGAPAPCTCTCAHSSAGLHCLTRQMSASRPAVQVKHKYTPRLAELFTETFCWLPLAHCLCGKVLVVHGGLFSRDGVTLDEIRRIDRNRWGPGAACAGPSGCLASSIPSGRQWLGRRSRRSSRIWQALSVALRESCQPMQACRSWLHPVLCARPGWWGPECPCA